MSTKPTALSSLDHTLRPPQDWSRGIDHSIISSALADTPCADLGIDGVLKKFNATLSTSYTLGSQDLRASRKTTLHSILEPYVARNDDFGTVYGHLRPYWYDYDVTAIKDTLCVREKLDREMRRKLLACNRIRTREMFPRRLWDLYANRVVPYWVVPDWVECGMLWGISHAWLDENDRVNAMTPINGYEWPVPMPNDANLDRIRIEMLNLGAQYTWLDEWKLDVPSIGSVYKSTCVVCYFNGLGRPLHLRRDYFKSDRCWFRHAWTLQEITRHLIIGGESGDDIMEKEVQETFDEQLVRLQRIREQGLVLELASEMKNRVSSKPLDKVAGLAYLVEPDFLPTYDVEMSDMDAWEVLMDMMSAWHRGQLFLYFPEPGNGTKYWRPSWQQIMTNKHSMYCPFRRPGEVKRNGDTDGDWYWGYCIESAEVRGLDRGLKAGKRRKGKVVFKNPAGVCCTFTIRAKHVYPIPDGSYTLIRSSNNSHNSGYDYRLWVVGQLREDGKFQKLSVFFSEDDEQVNPSKRARRIMRLRGAFMRSGAFRAF
ncbi:hypothetical protein EDD18DRAFT_1461173 [Armillaria luteobubalina]|uniref:Heterokaryon incompatibility domain-containing protein n=1 Tax=Armillaria luteobubalina TaxID=153913 RepID=A0AA39QAH7_9AGAR|nr:hypothetical protein EDD18DRAFT_1461173 [Armillaria luteobubalina]